MTAQTFGQSPSLTYLGIEDPMVAFGVDEALAMRLLALRQADARPDPKTGVSVAPESAYEDAA
jgi:hypothetical protein